MKYKYRFSRYSIHIVILCMDIGDIITINTRSFLVHRHNTCRDLKILSCEIGFSHVPMILGISTSLFSQCLLIIIFFNGGCFLLHRCGHAWLSVPMTRTVHLDLNYEFMTAKLVQNNCTISNGNW